MTKAKKLAKTHTLKDCNPKLVAVVMKKSSKKASKKEKKN